ncbi:MAG TPA: hypothetical protein VEX11_00155, partial [Acetobacteraceae bacterium]|nr:hypothetical protein [Acetobacteraceae bacterium]
GVRTPGPRVFPRAREAGADPEPESGPEEPPAAAALAAPREAARIDAAAAGAPSSGTAPGACAGSKV